MDIVCCYVCSVGLMCMKDIYGGRIGGMVVVCCIWGKLGLIVVLFKIWWRIVLMFKDVVRGKG